MTQARQGGEGWGRRLRERLREQVPREDGESDEAWEARAESWGRKVPYMYKLAQSLLNVVEASRQGRCGALRAGFKRVVISLGRLVDENLLTKKDSQEDRFLDRQRLGKLGTAFGVFDEMVRLPAQRKLYPINPINPINPAQRPHTASRDDVPT